MHSIHNLIKLGKEVEEVQITEEEAEVMQLTEALINLIASQQEEQVELSQPVGRASLNNHNSSTKESVTSEKKIERATIVVADTLKREALEQTTMSLVLIMASHNFKRVNNLQVINLQSMLIQEEETTLPLDNTREVITHLPNSSIGEEKTLVLQVTLNTDTMDKIIETVEILDSGEKANSIDRKNRITNTIDIRKSINTLQVVNMTSITSTSTQMVRLSTLMATFSTLLASMTSGATMTISIAISHLPIPLQTNRK